VWAVERALGAATESTQAACSLSSANMNNACLITLQLQPPPNPKPPNPTGTPAPTPKMQPSICPPAAVSEMSSTLSLSFLATSAQGMGPERSVSRNDMRSREWRLASAWGGGGWGLGGWGLGCWGLGVWGVGVWGLGFGVWGGCCNGVSQGATHFLLFG